MQAAGILFRRELRGKKGLFLFAAGTMLLATTALTLVLSLSYSFESSLVAQGRVILGGDVDLRLSQREFSAAEYDWIKQNSTALSHIRISRGLAVAGENSQLIRIKGIDEQYPLFGELPLRTPSERNTPHTAVLQTTDGQTPAPAYISENLALLLELEEGDIFTAAGITLQVKNFIINEPDPDPRLWAGAPLVLVNKSVLEGESFMRPGALVSRHIRAVLPAGETLKTWEPKLNTAFPDGGWRLRTPENSQGTVRRVANRMRDFLALASLAAILLAGIGCGNALSAFLRARMRAIAVIKMVGGSAALIRRIYLMLATLFAAGGALIGAMAGMGAMFIIAPLLSVYLPTPLVAEWSTITFLRALLTALAMTAAFAAPPILRFARINPLTLFASSANEDSTPANDWQDRAVTGAAFVLVALALPLDWDKKIMLLGIVVIAAVLYGLTLVFAAVAQRLGNYLPIAWRWGLLAIARNRRQTAAGVMSFGVGICVLIAIINTENNFSARIDDTLRQKAPALYFMGILPDQHQPLEEIVTAQSAQASLRVIPFIRGRIHSIGGTLAKDIDAPPGEQWILRGDRGLTWTDGSYIGGSRVSEGVLWDDSIDGLQASFDDEAAHAFGIEIGDTLELNILGEKVTAVITNFRAIEWQSFDINFAILLSELPLAGLPHTFMGGAYLEREDAVPAQKEIYNALPNIVPINTAVVFDAIQNLLLRASILLKATALFLIFSGLPMIFATLIENRRRRLATATTLRLLGATRAVIIKAGIAEFMVMALLAVIPAALLGAFAGRTITTTIFELEWQSQWQSIAVIAVVSALLFLLLGAADIARAAKQAPFAMLRNE